MIRDIRSLALAACVALVAVAVCSGYEFWSVIIALMLIPWDMFGLWIAEVVELWQAGKASKASGLHKLIMSRAPKEPPSE